MKQAISKTEKIYDLYCMLIKDCNEVVPLVKSVDKIVGLPTDEQYEALMILLEKSLNNKVDAKDFIDDIDLELSKKIIFNYIGGYDYMMDNEKVTSGKVFVDRLGNEHKVYSVALNKKTIDKVRGLLPKIDSIVTVNNVLDTNSNGEYTDESYESLLALIKLALVDEKLTNKQLEKFLDVELAKNIIRAYLDLPLAG